MQVLMSWARTTAAGIEHRLGRAEEHLDRILLAVLIVLTVAVAYLFAQ